LQHQDGIHLPSGARAREELATVALAMKPQAHPLSAQLTAAQALSSINGAQTIWPVIDARGLRGMITREELEQTASNRGDITLGDLLPDPGPVEELDEARFPHVHPDHSLDSAMRRIVQSKLPALPVVSRQNIRELRGLISMQDILEAYALAAPSAAAEKPASPRMFAGVMAALVCLALFIGWLNYFMRLQRTNRAETTYGQAGELMKNRRYDEAIAHYREALSSSHNPTYRLALGEALVANGNFAESQIYLNEYLRANPANGPANLALARAAAGEHRVEDAIAHYQRAIYGSWPQDEPQHRFDARLELIDYFATAGRDQQAKAELMSAAAQVPPNDLVAARRVARKLLDMGMTKNAEEMFATVARRNPQDAQAQQGLADAKFTDGDYAGAEKAYRQLLAIDPVNPTAAARAGECARILQLQATAPGLTAAQRLARSRVLLADALETVQRCEGNAANPTDQERNAQAELARKVRPRAFSDAAALNVRLARELWNGRPSNCAGDDAVTRALAAQ
jgi:tetratricopeptide (TPR) repeat protein